MTPFRRGPLSASVHGWPVQASNSSAANAALRPERCSAGCVSGYRPDSRRCGGTERCRRIAAKHEVHPNQVGTWKRQAIEGLDEVFARGGSPGTSEHEATIRDLHAKIANSRGFGRLIKWYCQPGPIPACAGKPTLPMPSCPVRQVHPRVCGEARRGGAVSRQLLGPSPRVRGSRDRNVEVDPSTGSIPACAGKPTARGQPRPGTRVHPRVCGEARHNDDTIDDVSGPSPRVRGSHVGHGRHEHDQRSIPACAGKPAADRYRRSTLGVHPRVCGEACTMPLRDDVESGPSTRVRGSPSSVVSVPGVAGSIPACAGKPSPHPHRQCATRVHPRVCGEARDIDWRAGYIDGPSPRVRGSLCQIIDGISVSIQLSMNGSGASA